MAIAAGSRLGPYEILSLLGAGGMGEVYRAHDSRLHREVAIKVLAFRLAESPDLRQRFAREATLLAALNHPGIAHVYGFETATLPDRSQAHFLAMELVEGEDLARRLARGPVGVRDALAIALQVAEALEEAHEKGIVHRDLKPSNIKLTLEGRVKLLDFGLAKAWPGDPAGGCGYHGRYLPSGHVVYVHEGTLFAIPFDLGRLEAAGAAVPVIDELVAAPNTAGAQFAFSNQGALVYVPGRPPMVSIEWLDQSAKLTAVPAASAYYRHLRLSPDGTKLALQAFEGKGPNLLICDLGRGTISRLTFDASGGAFPVWAPDGRGVAYTAMRGGHPSNLYWQRADGTGSPRRLTEGDNLQIATSWHPSGGYLAIQEVNPQTGSDVMILKVQEDEAAGLKPERPTPILNGPYNESAAAFSPDGHWLAYASNESGRDEVYVRRFPGLGGKWQVSAEGGSYPVWSRSGRELFYETLDQRLMVAPCSQQNDSFHVEKPRRWAEAWLPDPRGFWTFDLHPDGKRFVVLQEVPEADRKGDHVVLFQDFFEEFRRLAPAR